jgi:hypothetical protein
MRAAWLVLLAVGCSREPKCYGEVDNDDMLRMQKEIAAGREPCPMHLTPKLVVDERGLELNSRRIGSREALPVDGTPRKIAPLFDELKRGRETWKILHPSVPFEPIVEITIPPDADFVPAASAIVTAAYAGYPHSSVRSGGMVLDLVYDVPRPPSDEAQPESDLYVERLPDARYDVHFRRGTIRARAPARPLELDSIPGWVDEMCPVPSEPCASAISLNIRGEFVIAATLLQRLQRTRVFSQRPPWIRFRDEPR